jgi:hypothetical protein
VLGLGTARHTILTTRLTPLNTAFGLGWAPAIAQSSTGTAIDPRLPGVNYTTGAEDQLCVPQTLGWKDGRAMLLGYQTGGQTSTGASRCMAMAPLTSRSVSLWVLPTTPTPGSAGT